MHEKFFLRECLKSLLLSLRGREATEAISVRRSRL
jgi:hypothetical protein